MEGGAMTFDGYLRNIKIIFDGRKSYRETLYIVFGGYSIIFVLTNFKLRLIGSLLIATGLFFVCRIKICRNEYG